MDLPHNGHTRCRFSVNAAPISTRLEGGTATVAARLAALRKLALPMARGGGGYPVGVVIAPIMPIEDWHEHYQYGSVSQRLKSLLVVQSLPTQTKKKLAIVLTEPYWEHYDLLLDSIETALDFDCDLTFELITHRFTPGSKQTLLEWYPQTKLEMDESQRQVKRNKFGGTKYVYQTDVMKELRSFFDRELSRRFPQARILYWT